MAQVEVLRSDTFETWRQKTNITAASVGDIAELETVNKNTVVEAINEVNTRAIVMAIALG